MPAGQKTNARTGKIASVANSPQSPTKDVCGNGACAHGQDQHGTSGACRFVKTDGCAAFVAKEN